jgi:hypothetical protein
VVEGVVEDAGITVADGTVIGVGDVIVTRQNQRDLAVSTTWVKNGDQWVVDAVAGDGGLTVRRETGGGVARLPTEYVSAHVELGYATTAHRAQGRTVDTAHAFVTSTTMREPMYVMATRGRESNILYVDTMYDPDGNTAHRDPDNLDPVDVLSQVLEQSGADLSATEVRAKEAEAASSPSRLAAEGAAVIAAGHARLDPQIHRLRSPSREM